MFFDPNPCPATEEPQGFLPLRGCSGGRDQQVPRRRVQRVVGASKARREAAEGAGPHGRLLQEVRAGRFCGKRRKKKDRNGKGAEIKSQKREVENRAGQ